MLLEWLSDRIGCRWSITKREIIVKNTRTWRKKPVNSCRKGARNYKLLPVDDRRKSQKRSNWKRCIRTWIETQNRNWKTQENGWKKGFVASVRNAGARA